MLKEAFAVLLSTDPLDGPPLPLLLIILLLGTGSFEK